LDKIPGPATENKKRFHVGKKKGGRDIQYPSGKSAVGGKEIERVIHIGESCKGNTTKPHDLRGNGNVNRGA